MCIVIFKFGDHGATYGAGQVKVGTFSAFSSASLTQVFDEPL